MSGNSQEHVDYVMDQLSKTLTVSSGRFFGGVGLSTEGVQFAMVMKSTLYFVVNDSTRSQYAAKGSECFSYATKKGRVSVNKYYQVPDDVLENQDELAAWAKQAIRIAHAMK
jgi:DNA transformation protein and related proteins